MNSRSCLTLLFLLFWTVSSLQAQVAPQANTDSLVASSLKHQMEFGRVLRRVQEQADSANQPIHTFAFANVLAGSTPAVTGDDAMRKELVSSIHDVCAIASDKFSTAGVFGNLAGFSLNTAIEFPGFKTAASTASLISHIASVGAGLAAAALSLSSKTNGASLSAAVAVIASGSGGIAGGKGQSTTLNQAFQTLNTMTQDIAVLQFLKQDFDLIAPGFTTAGTTARQLRDKATPDTLSEPDAINLANDYTQFVKAVDGLYDVQLMNLRNALVSQQSNPGPSPFNPATTQRFKDLIDSIDQARNDWKAVRYLYDNAVNQATTYVTTVKASTH